MGVGEGGGEGEREGDSVKEGEGEGEERGVVGIDIVSEVESISMTSMIEEEGRGVDDAMDVSLATDDTFTTDAWQTLTMVTIVTNSLIKLECR